MMNEPLRVGDRVQVLDDALEGWLEELRSDSAIIRTSDGFTLEIDPGQLVRIPEAAAQHFTVKPEDIAHKAAGKKAPRPHRSRKQRQTPPMEVDLHADKLLPNPGRMSTYEILEFQLQTASRQLEFAMRKRIQRVVFIHGIGEGVLKAELHALLRRYDDITYREGDPRLYGQGATEVYIPQTGFR
jgi:hypothetical protein